MFLEDYKTLKQSGVRSGDELTLVLKYKALQFKTVTVLLHFCRPDYSYESRLVPIHPFALVSELLTRGCGSTDWDMFFPIIVNGKLVPIQLNTACCLASYGDLGDSKWLYHSATVRRPILVVPRDSVLRCAHSEADLWVSDIVGFQIRN